MFFYKFKFWIEESLYLMSLLTRNPKAYLISMAPVLILGFPLLPVYLLYTYLSSDVDQKVLNHYLSLHRYRTSIAIRDEDNNFIGAIPSQLESPSKDFNHQQRQGALYVKNIPPVFWDVLMAREDRYLDFDYSHIRFWDMLTLKKRTYKGIDIFGMYSRILQDKGGGSGLINLIIKNMKGQAYFREKYGQGLTGKIRRKLDEFQGARHLFPYLAKNGGIEFKRWIAMHVPLLVANGDVYGIRAVSATVFGKKPKNLTKGEQAILAAAYLYNIRLQPPQFETAQKFFQARQARWNRIIRSAKEGVKNAYQTKNDLQYKSIIAELERFKPPEEPRLPASLQPFIADKSFNKKQAYANLILRTQAFLPGLDNLISSQIKQFYKKLPDNIIITEVKITLPGSNNYQFKRNLDKVLKKIESTYPFNKTLVPSNDPHSKKRADIRIVVAKLSGKIIRYYRRGEFLEGNRSVRRMASIAKIPAAVLLANLGDQPNKPLYCNQAYNNLQNASSSKGIEKCDRDRRKDWYTPKETFGASKNLPLRYALSKKHSISKAQLIQLYKAFGIVHPNQLKGSATTTENLIHGLSFGVAKATPMQMHRIIHELTAILYGRAQAPYFIEFIKFNQRDLISNESEMKKVTTPLKSAPLKIKDYLKNSSAKTFVKNTLSAPVYSNTGTLRSFKKIKGVRFLLAKSGTSQTYNKQNVKDKLVMGSMKIGEQIYTFSILVGSKAGDVDGLAKKVSHSQLMMPIMKEIVKSLQR
ncbi:MAG: hypothetical protein ABFS56_24410 [Pseudomonadota bacterium]